VHSFAALKTTPQAIAENLKLSADEFDQAYQAWLGKQVGSEPAQFDAWREQLKALVELAKAKQNDAVIAAAPAVIKLYPQYVEDASAYEFLAESQQAKNQKQAAADALTAYEKMGGESPEALKKLATLEEELGHAKEAAATLARVNYIYPEDEALHRKLGELWLAQGENAGAVREFSAVLALKPLDKAGAEYELAQAYFAQGDKGKAEESVLAALEVAPGFRPAQKLLVEIEGKN
jgi:tetratricopeptide (TPR) repeat protein